MPATHNQQQRKVCQFGFTICGLTIAKPKQHLLHKTLVRLEQLDGSCKVIIDKEVNESLYLVRGSDL